MNRFEFDVLDDREEEDQETFQQELIDRRGIPAYATEHYQEHLKTSLFGVYVLP